MNFLGFSLNTYRTYFTWKYAKHGKGFIVYAERPEFFLLLFFFFASFIFVFVVSFEVIEKKTDLHICFLDMVHMIYIIMYVLRVTKD